MRDGKMGILQTGCRNFKHITFETSADLDYFLPRISLYPIECELITLLATQIIRPPKESYTNEPGYSVTIKRQYLSNLESVYLSSVRHLESKIGALLSNSLKDRLRNFTSEQRIEIRRRGSTI